MKTIKQLALFLFACTSLLVSCKSNPTGDDPKSVDEVIDEIKESTSVSAKEGKGKISLQCNGKTYEISGVCGAVTTMGSTIIAIKDENAAAKVFTISFNTDKLPGATSSYKIVKSSIDDEDAGHVVLSYTDMRQPAPMIWESNDTGGNLNFTVNGNEIKCTFSNIPLQSNSFYNKGELDNPATVSGELTLYKN